MGPSWGAFCQITLTSCSIITVSCAVYELFSVKFWHGLEIWVSRPMSWKMVQFDIPHTTYYQSASVTVVISCIISEINRDIGRKSIFLIAPALDVPLAWSLSEYCHTVLRGKTRMVWLPEGEKV